MFLRVFLCIQILEFHTRPKASKSSIWSLWVLPCDEQLSPGAEVHQSRKLCPLAPQTLQLFLSLGGRTGEWLSLTFLQDPAPFFPPLAHSMPWFLLSACLGWRSRLKDNITLIFPDVEFFRGFHALQDRG